MAVDNLQELARKIHEEAPRRTLSSRYRALRRFLQRVLTLPAQLQPLRGHEFHIEDLYLEGEGIVMKVTVCNSSNDIVLDIDGEVAAVARGYWGVEGCLFGGRSRECLWQDGDTERR